MVDDKLGARAKLIYERDNNSPLFLRTADLYIKNGEIQTALAILENGLKTFPEHPLAFILMAKIFATLGHPEKAQTYFNKSSEQLNNRQTLEHYKSEYKLSDKLSSPFDNSRGSIFLTSSDDEEKSEMVNRVTDPVDDHLSEIANELINRKIERPDETTFTTPPANNYSADTSKLATETLANIYLSQGQKTEAIKIYELLIRRNPENKEYYEGKIKKIKSQ
jgi:tetratricopeptide (TPR) repeat protein